MVARTLATSKSDHAFFNSLRMPGTLFFGLGYELVPFSGAKEDIGMEALVAAHAHMKYDLFMLAASKREWNVPFAVPSSRMNSFLK